MYIPMVHERVRVQGRRGIHVVVFADYGRCVADIGDISDHQAVEKGVAFAQLFAVWENTPRETVNQDPSQIQNNA
jgi:hypothetical protein